MNMDVDWCLTCQKHIEGSSPYCSTDCELLAVLPEVRQTQDFDDDEDDGHCSVAFEDDNVETGPTAKWLGNDDAGIAAWAAEIPPGAPAGDIVPLCEPTPAKCPTSSATYRPPPNLLKYSRRVVPPSLCVTPSVPQSPRTSSPIVTPLRQSSSTELLANKASLSKISSKSAKTDSPLLTPASSHGSHAAPILCPSRKSFILGEMYTHVRSWVSPSPAVVVPVEPSQQQRPLPPLNNCVDHPSKFQKTLASHPRFMVTATLKSPKCETTYGRSRPHDLACHDEIPSFRARGRKASRAAA